MKRVTLKDIAEIANVSVTTVSKALANHSDISEATKARIHKICREAKYVPNANAALLRSNSSNLIAVVVSDNTNLYFGELLKIIEHELSKKDYCIIIFNTNESEKRELLAINKLLSMNVAGVIITPVSSKSIEVLREYDIPFVMASRYVDIDEDNYVVPDDVQAGYIATKKIIESAPENNFFFIGSNFSFSTYKDRLNGYFKALNEANLKIEMGNIVTDVYGNEDGYIATKKILKRNKPPYSFICMSDFVAIGALKAFNEENIKIPEQARLVSFDNLKIFDYSRPSITTVDMQSEKIGITCAEALLKLIDAKERGETLENIREVMSVELIEKETC